MIEVRSTEAAANDLERVADYLFEHAPERAARIVLAINKAPEKLVSFPGMG